MKIPIQARRAYAAPLALMLLALAAPANLLAQEKSSPAEVTRQIDAYFDRYWAEHGLKPSPAAEDAAFLRRAMLDLTGIIPEISEVRGFLADDRPEKRRELIDNLLERPRHAAHLAHVWRQVLLPRTVPDSTAAGLENWLQSRFAENAPYDHLVRDILLARGTLTQSPPVLYYSALQTKPSELAASSSRVFLGVQIRCAECHDHPFTDWKQEDFWGLAAFFARVRGSQAGGMLDDGPTGDVRHPKTKKTVQPVLFDGTKLAADTGESRRAQLAGWITSPRNPYFAQATVNRLWSVLFGRGLVHPVDDLGEHNPATHPQVLQLLAADFVEHGFDLRRTLRVLAGTKIYQQSVGGADQNWMTNYTTMPVRSLSARQVFNCLVRAAGRRDAIDPRDPAVAQQRDAFLAQIDAPTRQATEFQGGIPQTLTMLNGPLVTELTDAWTGDLVSALADSPFLNHEQRVETLFLAAVSRRPTKDELQQTLPLLRTGSADTSQALGDILWALLNSSEFLMNH